MHPFMKGYLDCALWSSTDEFGNPLDDLYEIDNFHPATVAEAGRECLAFMSDNAELLEGLDLEQAGFDFWLTRNRHGSGYWDRGLGEIGEKLTKAAHAWGSCDIIVGTDHYLHML